MNEIIDKFVKEFCKKYYINIDTLMSETRDPLITKMRYIVIDSIYNNFNSVITYSKIAKYFSRTVGFVQHARTQSNNLLSVNDKYATRIKQILDEIKVEYD